MEKLDLKIMVNMFGRMELATSEGTLTDKQIRSLQTYRLLAYLIYNRGKNITLQELIDVLWFDEEVDEPYKILRNIVYRTRNLLKPISLGEDFIVASKGSYIWNQNILVELDADIFAQLCKSASDMSSTSVEDRIQAYQKAIDLFQGEFLPKISAEHWVMPVSIYYQSMFISAINELAAILKEEAQYDALADVCTKGLSIDPYDEHLHSLMIQSLIAQGKENMAIEHYHNATNLLYTNFGTRPSDELRSLYQQLQQKRNDEENDIDQILEQLFEADCKMDKGAYFCEYGAFQEVYRVTARQAKRYGMSIYVVLLNCKPTSKLKPGDKSYLRMMNSAMDNLQTVIFGSLRRGDVFTKYSGTQFLILLPTCTHETADMVARRIVNNFHIGGRMSHVEIQYKLSQIKFPSEDN